MDRGTSRSSRSATDRAHSCLSITSPREPALRQPRRSRARGSRGSRVLSLVGHRRVLRSPGCDARDVRTVGRRERRRAQPLHERRGHAVPPVSCLRGARLHPRGKSRQERSSVSGHPLTALALVGGTLQTAAFVVIAVLELASSAGPGSKPSCGANGMIRVAFAPRATGRVLELEYRPRLRTAGRSVGLVTIAVLAALAVFRRQRRQRRGGPPEKIT